MNSVLPFWLWPRQPPAAALLWEWQQDLRAMSSAFSQTGPFFPGFTISYAILGFLFGLILYRAKITPLRAFAAGLAEFIIACTLNTMWLHFMYGMEWEYLFTIRLIKNTVSLGVNSVLLFVFMKAFSRIILTVSPALKASRQ